MHGMKTNENRLDTEPWYKQFWPWFLISLPLSAVIAGISTVIIAVNNQDSMVADDYYKEGMAINMQLDKQQHAVGLGIEANATYSVVNNSLTISMQGDNHYSVDSLILFARHTTLADKDRVVMLNYIGKQQYQVQMEPLPQGRWYLILEPVDASWRLDASVKHDQENWSFTPEVH